MTTPLRDCILPDLEETIAWIVNQPNERVVGYIEGKLAAFLMASTITLEEYDYFFGQLVAANLSARGHPY